MGEIHWYSTSPDTNTHTHTHTETETETDTDTDTDTETETETETDIDTDTDTDTDTCLHRAFSSWVTTLFGAQRGTSTSWPRSECDNNQIVSSF